ncbi:MAG: 2-C-methyl-D-erythritol 4-phosphate cytidylyltransferase [Lachnospiraceae bacterium]|nr:2-C-methyl-D-erythritol 4-phosphate cytidylyltransferase [Lachnospiraceae bacterium]
MPTYSAIVLAGGSGKRMGSEIPKQYMMLNGNPVLSYCLKAFEKSPVDEIILVTRAGDEDYCTQQIIAPYHIDKCRTVICGGAQRYDSVLAGLKKAKGDYVLIHDGARPFLSQDLILRMMDAVVREKAAAAAVPVTDTIKEVNAKEYILGTPDRSALRAMQTPQAFDRELLLQGYHMLLEERDGLLNVTDDAMIIEKTGLSKVKLVMGDYNNRKLTTKEDKIWANFFAKSVDEYL